jgi:hypothetical protein
MIAPIEEPLTSKEKFHQEYITSLYLDKINMFQKKHTRTMVNQFQSG